MPGSRAADYSAPVARPGDLVIRALVRARLLGIRLLTLEARVVLGPEDGFPAIAATRMARAGAQRLPADAKGSRSPPLLQLVSDGRPGESHMEFA